MLYVILYVMLHAMLYVMLYVMLCHCIMACNMLSMLHVMMQTICLQLVPLAICFDYADSFHETFLVYNVNYM